ncbi:sulfite exporter TauE/SafE family protein [Cohnella sp. 56]|uniref:sulfite exporter TauE/SafE family protein n=1 Tax=Cohnella sp. 56 TaxID=3113722 RepID=UPI0030E9DA58
MDILLVIVMLAIGLVGSFFSGLLGIGGAIINYPLLLYVPSMLGIAHFSAHEVSSISMFQVFFASLAGVLAFRRKRKEGASGVVHKGLVLYMGSGILAGSLIGGYVSGMLHGDVINLIYGVLAVLAVMLMLIPVKGKEDQPAAELRFNKWVAVGAALVVGVLSGIVGAGGAFILIPIMLNVLRIPMRTTIASSLAIVFVSAIGGVIGKIGGGGIPLWPTVFTVIGSLIGASHGSKISTKLNVKLLRYGLVVLIALTAVKVWSNIL